MRIDERHTSELLGQSTHTMSAAQRPYRADVPDARLCNGVCHAHRRGGLHRHRLPGAGPGGITARRVAHYLEHKMFDCPYGDAMQRF